MSIRRWIARKGSVGGTARWAGKFYWSIKKQSPNISINDLLKEIISVRYRSESNSTVKNAFHSIVDEGNMAGLVSLVTNILSVEAGYRENSPENRFMFMEVIREELENLDIPENDIQNFSNHLSRQ
jgi:hypothetical protein